MYVKKFTSFCQVLKKDAHQRKLVPVFCLTVYILSSHHNSLAAAAAAATIRYDTRCYFNVRSKADMSRLNLPHGDDN